MELRKELRRNSCSKSQREAAEPARWGSKLHATALHRERDILLTGAAMP